MPAWLAGLIIVGGTTGAAVGGIFAVRKYVPSTVLKPQHDVAGYMLAIVAALYAILLGLLVVNVQTKYEQAKTMAQTESNACKTIWHLTRALPDHQRDSVRDPLYEYVLSVQAEDWEAIACHHAREQTIPHYQRLWGSIAHLEPQNGKEESAFAALLATMTQLSDARHTRMIAGSTGLSPVLWSVLILGGVLSILFTYFFHVENLISQIIMTVFVSIFLSLNIFLVYLYNNPYRNELGVKASAFDFDPGLFDYRKLERGNDSAPDAVPSGEKSSVEANADYPVASNRASGSGTKQADVDQSGSERVGNNTDIRQTEDSQGNGHESPSGLRQTDSPALEQSSRSSRGADAGGKDQLLGPSGAPAGTSSGAE